MITSKEQFMVHANGICAWRKNLAVDFMNEVSELKKALQSLEQTGEDRQRNVHLIGVNSKLDYVVEKSDLNMALSILESIHCIEDWCSIDFQFFTTVIVCYPSEFNFLEKSHKAYVNISKIIPQLDFIATCMDYDTKSTLMKYLKT